MSDAKFTPGPWHWVAPDEKIERCEVLLSGTGKEICDFGYYTQYYPVEGSAPSAEDRALMAAAPDLYEALQLVWDTYGFDPSIDSAIWQTVQSALKKARGESNG